jgi:hypothetical protein
MPQPHLQPFLPRPQPHIMNEPIVEVPPPYNTGYRSGALPPGRQPMLVQPPLAPRIIGMNKPLPGLPRLPVNSGVTPP